MRVFSAAVGRRNAFRTGLLAAVLGHFLATAACTKTNFAGPAPAGQQPNPPPGPQPPANPDPGPAPAPPQPPATTTNNASVLTPTFTDCSPVYQVPARANPYLAGVPNGTTIRYDLSKGGGPNPTDTTAMDSPVLVAPIDGCLVPGQTLYFTVSGAISHAANLPSSDANGNLREISPHQLGALFGKSSITAPLNSLIAVFLGDGDPSGNAAPEALDFSAQAARDYVTLSPKLGQVFYVGNGKTSAGDAHQVVIPQGATRLYFAIMDSYQWNNNHGTLSGGIMKRSN